MVGPTGVYMYCTTTTTITTTTEYYFHYHTALSIPESPLVSGIDGLTKILNAFAFSFRLLPLYFSA